MAKESVAKHFLVFVTRKKNGVPALSRMSPRLSDSFKNKTQEAKDTRDKAMCITKPRHHPGT